jgi:hypothetical protein
VFCVNLFPWMAILTPQKGRHPPLHIRLKLLLSAAERRHTLFWSGGDALGKIPAAKAAIGINAMRQPSNKSTDIGPATERVFEGRARFACW